MVFDDNTPRGYYYFKASYLGQEIGKYVFNVVDMIVPQTTAPPKTPNLPSENVELDKEQTVIPNWIKTTAGWWAEGQIGEADFLGGIQHLIKERIINIPDLPQSASSTANSKVPDWIKNNAGWWANGLIGEDDFVSGIKYLVEQGIMRV